MDEYLCMTFFFIYIGTSFCTWNHMIWMEECLVAVYVMCVCEWVSVCLWYFCVPQMILIMVDFSMDEVSVWRCNKFPSKRFTSFFIVIDTCLTIDFLSSSWCFTFNYLIYFYTFFLIFLSFLLSIRFYFCCMIWHNLLFWKMNETNFWVLKFELEISFIVCIWCYVRFGLLHFSKN